MHLEGFLDLESSLSNHNLQSKYRSVDRLCGDTCSYVRPQIWLNEARTDIGLSLTTGFLNENDWLVYFLIFGELSSSMSFIVGFFKTSSFLSLLSRISIHVF